MWNHVKWKCCPQLSWEKVQLTSRHWFQLPLNLSKPVKEILICLSEKSVSLPASYIQRCKFRCLGGSCQLELVCSSAFLPKWKTVNWFLLQPGSTGSAAGSPEHAPGSTTLKIHAQPKWSSCGGLTFEAFNQPHPRHWEEAYWSETCLVAFNIDLVNPQALYILQNASELR